MQEHRWPRHWTISVISNHRFEGSHRPQPDGLTAPPRAGSLAKITRLFDVISWPRWPVFQRTAGRSFCEFVQSRSQPSQPTLIQCLFESNLCLTSESLINSFNIFYKYYENMSVHPLEVLAHFLLSTVMLRSPVAESTLMLPIKRKFAAYLCVLSEE